MGQGWEWVYRDLGHPMRTKSLRYNLELSFSPKLSLGLYMYTSEKNRNFSSIYLPVYFYTLLQAVLGPPPPQRVIAHAKGRKTRGGSSTWWPHTTLHLHPNAPAFPTRVWCIVSTIAVYTVHSYNRNLRCHTVRESQIGWIFKFKAN